MLSNEAADWVTFVSCSCDLSQTPHHTTQTSSESLSSGELMENNVILCVCLKTLQGESITGFVHIIFKCTLCTVQL